MKLKNNIYYFGLVAATLLSSGCKKVLEENPRSSLTPAIISTPSGIEASMSGAYSNLRWFWGTEGFAYSANAGSDEVLKGRDGTDSWFNYVNILPSDNNISAIWAINYENINNLNGIIEFAPAAAIDETIKKIRIGEAKFLRAFCYFQLVQNFGDVPLNLTFNTVPTTSSSRAPLADVYASIIRDLQDASAVLPPKGTPTQGRASKAAALHLLGKVYLTRGWSSATQSGDFSNARITADSLINNRTAYGVDLWPDYADVFKEGNEYGMETIFLIERNTNAVASESGFGNIGQQEKENRSNYFWRPLYTDGVPALADSAANATMETILDGATTYSRNALMDRDVVNGRPFLRFRPTKYTLDVAFADRINDSRYDNTFQKAWIFNKANVIATRRGTLVRGVDTAIYMPGREVTLAERNAFKGVIIEPAQYNSVWFPSMKKHDDQTRLHFNDASDRPYILFRLGETYLIAAEAAFKEGNPDVASQYINVIRHRASYRTYNSAAQNSDALAAVTISGADITKDFLLDEYTRERYGEYTRWYDLVRTGSLVERVKKYSETPGVSIQDHHVLRPIPQNQIDRTTTGPPFIQNPGY